MSMALGNIYPVFFDKSGKLIAYGSLYVGTAGLNPRITSNQIPVYTDAALTMPIAQPISILSGIPRNGTVLVGLYVDADDFSMITMVDGITQTSSLHAGALFNSYPSSPTFIAPALGNPVSGTLSNCAMPSTSVTLGVTEYTTTALTSDDANTHVLYANGTSDVAITLDKTCSPGWWTKITRQGSGTVTITPASGAKLNNGAATIEIPRYSTATITCLRNTLNAEFYIEVSNPGISSGHYAPTLTQVAYLTSANASRSYYQRIGDVVTVTGSVDIMASSGMETAILGISLPIASDLNAVNSVRLYGVASSASASSVDSAMRIAQDDTNNRAELRYYASSTDQITINYIFTYQLA